MDVITLLGDFLSLFFPAYCIICTQLLVKGERCICTDCFYALPQTDYHQEVDNPVAYKLYGRVSVVYAMAFYKFRKGGKIQKVLHQLKYNNQPLIGELIGRRYGTLLKESPLGHRFDIIIPVPLHWSKLQERGYNQSAFFAQGLAAGLGIPWHDQYLVRIKKTATQTTKDRLERLQNMQAAFAVKEKDSLQGKHLLIVDDLITTGATLEACIQALSQAGVQQISVATLAVAE